MKKLILLILFFSSFLSNGWGQPGIVEHATDNSRYSKETARLCYKIQWGFDNYQVYSLCDNTNDSNFGEFSIVLIPCTQDCYLNYKVFINDTEIDLQKNGWDSSFDLKTFLDGYYIPFLDRENVVIRVEIKKICTDKNNVKHTTTDIHSRVIQMVDENSEYSVFEDVGPGWPADYNPCEQYKNSEIYNEFLTCCGEKSTIEMSYSKTLTSESGHLGKSRIEIRFNLNSIITGVSASGSQEYSIPVGYTSISSNITRGISKSLNADKPGFCVYPAITTNFTHIIERIYINDCNPVTEDVQIGIKDHYIPLNHNIMLCGVQTICPNIEGSWDNIDEKILARSSCLKNLKLNIVHEDKIYSYTWILPDGSEIETGNEFLAEQAGLYRCIVKDECCNEKEFIYNNCKQLQYNDWFFDNGKYCCIVTCNCDPTFRNTSEDTYIMCVNPDRYDNEWSFNEYTKKCNKHAYWTDQNGAEIDLTYAVNEEDIDAEDENVYKKPKITEYYDEWDEKCIREYDCEDSGDNSTGMIDEAPTFSDEWEYDDFSEKCYREIFCFGSSDPATDEDGFDIKDEGEAGIEWEFNEYDFICYGTVYCDDDETDNEVEEEPDAEWDWDDDEDECITTHLECDGEDQDEISESGSDYGDWEWDIGDSECYRSIYCNLADEEFIDYSETYSSKYDPSYENKCNDDECTYYIVCDGELQEDIYECYSCPDGSIAERDYIFDKKSINKGKRIVINSTGTMFKKTNRLYKYYKVIIYTSDGRNTKVRTKDVKNYIDYFKKYKSQRNIMYFYTVYGENELLYSKKFFVAKK